MTHRTPPPPRICSTCDGFAAVAVASGGRDPRGHLRTVTAHCPTCNGTGTTRPAARESARA